MSTQEPLPLGTLGHDDGYPILAAYREGIQLYTWCEHERTWHMHGAVTHESDAFGAGNGHRAAHCVCSNSPLRAKGYILQEVGPFTPEVKRSHGRITHQFWCPTCRRIPS